MRSPEMTNKLVEAFRAALETNPDEYADEIAFYAVIHSRSDEDFLHHLMARVRTDIEADNA